MLREDCFQLGEFTIVFYRCMPLTPLEQATARPLASIRGRLYSEITLRLYQLSGQVYFTSFSSIFFQLSCCTLNHLQKEGRPYFLVQQESSTIELYLNLSLTVYCSAMRHDSLCLYSRKKVPQWFWDVRQNTRKEASHPSISDTPFLYIWRTLFSCFSSVVLFSPSPTPLGLHLRVYQRSGCVS